MLEKFLTLSGLFWGVVFLSVLLGSVAHSLLLSLGPISSCVFLVLFISGCLWLVAWQIDKHQ
jgi:hypothetical protein